MKARSSTHAEIAPARQSWVYHHPRWIVGWAIFVATGCVLWMALGASNPRWAVLLFDLYALQGLIAEGLGVRVCADHISAPRRFWVLPPVVVFWRAKGSLNSIQDLTVTTKGLSSRQAVRLKWFNGDTLPLLFSNCDKKLEFLNIVRKIRPLTSIYKAHEARDYQYAYGR